MDLGCTTSEELMAAILREMREEGGCPIAHVPPHKVAPEQTAAVWFSINRINGCRICVVQTGSTLSDIGWVIDVAPGCPHHGQLKFAKPTPPFSSLRDLARRVLHLLNTDCGTR